MDFAVSPEIHELEARARAFARDVLAPQANELDRTGEGMERQLGAVHEAGLLGLLIERESGGLGTDPQLFVRVISALASGCPSTALCVCLHAASAATILIAAGPAQRQRVAQAVTREGAICAVAVSEPRTGANPNAPETTATRDGDQYVLTGTKSFVTNARWAAFVMAVARHDDQPGTSSFLIEPAAASGFGVCRDWAGFGMRATGSDQVVLDHCRVPREAVLGEPGKSAQATRRRGPVIPLGQAAVSIGAAQSALNRLAELDLTRSGQPGTAALREARGLLAGARALLDRAAWLTAAWPAELGRAVAEAKLVADTSAIRIADLAHEHALAAGIVADPTLDRLRRDARAGGVMTMNAEICRDHIARSLLGLGE